MLDLEERAYYKEVVDNAQRGNEDRLDEMRRRLQEIHAKREKEREEIVMQKRIQQFMLVLCATKSIIAYLQIF